MLKLMLMSAALVLALAQPAHADFDYTVYSGFLESYVKTGRTIDGIRTNAVDYARVAVDALDNTSTPYPKLLAELSRFDPDTLATRQERVAFWINAYNIAAMKMIIDHYPVDSIRSSKISLLTLPWKKDVIDIGGKDYDLNTIEHVILLGRLAEPRAHFGVVCASASCADLADKPYLADTLDGQLEAAGRAFVNNPRKGVRIDRAAGVVYVSKVFDWGGRDFERMGGLASVLEKYLDAPADREYVRAGGYRIKYMDYNWRLNDVKLAR